MLLAFAHCLAAFVTLAGCSAIDTVDDRAMTMNQSVNRYRNNAILSNVIRSSKEEPLNFASISGIVGHNTVQLGVPGTPSINLTPKVVLQSENATSGQYSFSNDFTYTQVDDAQTTQALATPLDPATMANFFQRGLPSDFLLLLFVNKIRIADENGRVLAEYYPGYVARSCSLDDPRCPIKQTLIVFTWLAAQGLTFRTEKGAVPGQSKSPQAQICFEPDLQRGSYKQKFIQSYGRPTLTSSSQQWPEGSRMLVPKYKGDPPSFCNDPRTWLNPPAPSAPTTLVCIKSLCDSKKPGTGTTPSASYKIYDKEDRVWIEIFTRSTFGIYDFLGDLLRKQSPVRMLFGPTYAPFEGPILFNVTNDSTNCFAQVYDGVSYCVPNQNSDLTKASFSIVHQLAALYTSVVSAAPITSTVRITP